MLNQFNLSKNHISKAQLALIIFALLIALSGCGKRKPPLPPVEKVSQRVELSGIQRGNTVILSWTLPEKNAAQGNILNVNRVDIYRLAELLNAPLALSEEEFASNSTLISTVEVTEAEFAKKNLTYNDSLEFAGQPARLRYAVRFVNSSGQKAAFSNFLLIEPTAKVAGVPTLLSVKVSESAIKLSWNAPNSNVDGTKPANILGYNAYRREIENEVAILLNNTPISDTNFSDVSFEFGKEYSYLIRAVSLGSDGELVLSLDSNTVVIKPQDTFAPNPPSALTIAAAPRNLAIFFAANLEKDVVGYRIYRSINPNLQKSEWTLLTPELLKTNTFQDANVESGKTYFYYLIAVDKIGNVSEPSEVISETAP